MHHPTDRLVHTTAFVATVVEHRLEREIAQWVHHEGSIWWRKHFFKRNPPPCRLFYHKQQGFFYMHSHRQDNTYHGHWWTSCGPLVGIENTPHSMDRSDDRPLHRHTRYCLSYCNVIKCTASKACVTEQDCSNWQLRHIVQGKTAVNDGFVTSYRARLQ